jgi:hypothetical protein
MGIMTLMDILGLYKMGKNVAATPLGMLCVHHYRALTHTATKILALRAFFEHFAPVSTPYANL